MRKSNIDFLIVGAPKSGTTSLSDALRKNRHIYIPEEKEMHFFDSCKKSKSRRRKYERKMSSERISGEASPSYLSSPGCAERIKEYAEDVKIIAILRDPIKRAFSNYRFSRQYGKLKGSFKKEIIKSEKRNNESYRLLLSPGFYGSQINDYIGVFGRDKMFVRSFKYMVGQQKSFMNEIQKFLGVEKELNSIPKSNTTTKKPKTSIHQKVIYKIRNSWALRAASKIFPERIKKRLKQKAISISSKKSSEKKKIGKEEVEMLKNIYRQDVSLLNDLTDVRTDHWLAAE